MNAFFVYGKLVFFYKKVMYNKVIMTRLGKWSGYVYMKIKRITAIAVLTTILLMLPAACTNTNTNTNTEKLGADIAVDSSAQTKTTLRFISSWGGVDSRAETLKKVLDKFQNDYPNITVVNESLFGEDFLPKIKTDFASGNDPDVFGLWPGSDINALIKANKVADLTELLNEDAEWKNSFNSSMWDYTTKNGKIYGLPVEVIFECMFVNKDLFKKFGIPLPDNYNELKMAVTLFRKYGIVPIAFNTYSEGTYLYQNLIPMIGGKSGTVQPFEDCNVKDCHIIAMNYVKELYDMGAFPENCFTLTNYERNTLFKEKKAAMIVQGSWYIGDFDADDKTVDIIPMPYIEGYEYNKNTMVYGLGGGSFHMSASVCDDKDKYSAAVSLLKTLTSSETAATFASETGLLSNVNIDEYNIEYRDLTIKGRKMLDEAEHLVGPADSFVDRTSWENDISQQFPFFLLGEITADEVWDNAIRNGIIPD